MDKKKPEGKGMNGHDKKSPLATEKSVTETATEKGYMLKKHYVTKVQFQYSLEDPQSFKLTATPELHMNIRAIPTVINDNDYNVVLSLEVKGTSEGKNLFEGAVSYAGIFSLKNLNENERDALLGIECPHLLYPYARRIIMDLIIESGFPAANLPPINFATLYRQQQKKKQDTATT